MTSSCLLMSQVPTESRGLFSLFNTSVNIASTSQKLRSLLEEDGETFSFRKSSSWTRCLPSCQFSDVSKDAKHTPEATASHRTSITSRAA
ncbi:uncharacterized protein V6R79_025366 [Siganus canaliculatus]